MAARWAALVGVLLLHAFGALTTIPVPFLWWMPSYIVMVLLVYGWD